MSSKQAITPADCTLAILAGGMGSRMGVPKAELRIGRQFILPFLLDRFNWPGPTLLVTAPGRTAPPGSDRFSAEASDPESGLGPLRGVLTALEHAKTAATLITTVDMPALAFDHLQWLVDQLNSHATAIGVMPTRMLGGDRLIEPFPSIFTRAARPVVQAQLALGRGSVYRLNTEPAMTCVPSPVEWPADLWTNLNEPDDLTRFTHRLLHP